jgi:hypothetical protein
MFNQRKREKLEKRRREVLSTIRGEQLTFEAMVQRAQRYEETPDAAFLTSVRTNLADIEQKATKETDIDELDCLSGDAEKQGQ